MAKTVEFVWFKSHNTGVDKLKEGRFKWKRQKEKNS